MKDKVYMVLAVCGLIVLIVVYVFNHEGAAEQRVFSVDGYYVPEARNQIEDAAQIYKQMTSRSITCPTTTLSVIKDPKISFSGVYGQYNKSVYGVKFFFLTPAVLGLDNYSISSNNYWEVLHFTDRNLKLDNVKLSDLFDSTITVDTTDYPAIIAPCDFTFGNLNTDDSGIPFSAGSQPENIHRSIVIYGTTGNCKIVFDNVANWFCAGEPGTNQVTGTGLDDNLTDWLWHSHNSIFGNSKNSVISRGGAGSILGYAGPNTTVSIYNVSGDQETPITIDQWINSRY